MKRTLKFATSALLLIVALSCDETTIVKNYTGTGEEKTYSIEGYAQKGPFIIGSNVTVSELNEDLYPTGKVFFATILDNEGRFELPGVLLVSPYIQIKVEGSYFTETQGGVPTGEVLTLYSIADIRDKQTINVNILTHLEKDRVEHLVQDESKSFKEAKKQALDELLKVFDLNNYDVPSSEELSMLSESEGNAVLLTISAIIEGFYNYERKLELITNFQRDFQDGVLDDVEIQNTLLASALCLDPDRIVSHLTTRFPEAPIPNFKPVLSHFIENSSYTNYFGELFTEAPSGSINLLEPVTEVVLDPANDYVLYVKPPKGVEVWLSIDLHAFHYGDEGSFNISSSTWMESEVHSGCGPGEDVHCPISYDYRYSASGQDLNVIKIPIKSFSGKGTLNFSFDLVIDGFTAPELSLHKNFTWGD